MCKTPIYWSMLCSIAMLISCGQKEEQSSDLSSADKEKYQTTEITKIMMYGLTGSGLGKKHDYYIHVSGVLEKDEESCVFKEPDTPDRKGSNPWGPMQAVWANKTATGDIGTIKDTFFTGFNFDKSSVGDLAIRGITYLTDKQKKMSAVNNVKLNEDKNELTFSLKIEYIDDPALFSFESTKTDDGCTLKKYEIVDGEKKPINSVSVGIPTTFQYAVRGIGPKLVLK